MDTSVWWSGDLFSAMRATLSADRSREHLEAHKNGDTVVGNKLRAQDVVGYATVGGANALGKGSLIGSIAVGKKADLVLIRNSESPALTPIVNTYGTIVYQAQRGDVELVIVNGKVEKANHKLVNANLQKAKEMVEETVEYARSTMGENEWINAMNPEIPTTERIPNPYTYSNFEGADAQHRPQNHGS